MRGGWWVLGCASLGLWACSSSPSGQDGGPIPPPSIQTVSPDAGSTLGSTVISVTGANFQTGAQVFFGGAAASDVNVISAYWLTAATPPSDAGVVDVRVQNPDGQSVTASEAFRYVTPPPRFITEALLLNPASATDTSGTNPVPLSVRADVRVPGVTDGGTQGGGVLAQAGWGPGSATDFSAFAWTSASYAGKSSDPAMDRYAGTVQLPGATGSQVLDYLVTVRFSVDQGATWTYADRAGADGGTQFSELSSEQVSQPAPAIAFCKTESVTNSSPASGESITAHGLVVANASVLAEVGVGTQADNPQSSAAWGWRPAAFDAHTDAGDDYAATFGPAYSGSRQVAFRFSVDDGGAWTYCDATGDSDGGYDPGAGWNLNVGVPQLDFCSLQFPATLSADAGPTVVYGQVWVPGVTTQDAGDRIAAQLGWGPQAEDPGVAASWTWIDAGYDTPQFSNRNDEFHATFSPTPPVGSSYVFRFTVDGGSWCYGDLGGSGDDLNGLGQQLGFSGGSNIGTVTP